ncbi:O-methyltransferase family 3 protein [Rutstroemia sp. NJR-2017a BVV2]|nr:O-methyltransferase family 3 protein [Rutstroemia sp. NJR-2017a BVV2]
MPPPNRPHFTPDPGWQAVDEYSLSHLHPTSRPNHETLEHALENSKTKGLPPMQSSRAQAKFLALQCKLMRVKNVLEVGTLGAFASIYIATENPDCKITTIEFNPKHAEVARENIGHAGVGDRVEVLVGPAVDILPDLLKEIEDGKRERFGMTFIDADKLNNWTYCDYGIKMSYSGAVIFVDNMACRGALVQEDSEDPHVIGARKAIEEVGRDDRVDGVVMQIVSEKNWDGFLMAVVK